MNIYCKKNIIFHQKRKRNHVAEMVTDENRDMRERISEDCLRLCYGRGRFGYRDDAATKNIRLYSS